jgi:Xaa-Pro aminopeptidase
MLTMHPTLLVGPADWDPARLPKEEFDARIAAFWRACDPGIAGVVVFGSPRHHAELAYLTHFIPKLEGAIALVPREGAPCLLVGGGANMLGSAKPLTWVETLLPLRDAGTTIARWRDDIGGLALVNGDTMPLGLRQSIETTLGAPPLDATALVTEAMRRKSPRELALIREACASLDAAFFAMHDAQRARTAASDVVLAGEQAAWQRGAQDVRSLYGRDGRLAPHVMRDDAPADPLHVYLAVRHDGYWAEGVAGLAQADQPMVESVRAMICEALPLAKPGAPYRALAEVLARAAGARAYPAPCRDFGGAVGLALEESGCLTSTSWGRFAAGEVFSLRAGLQDDAGEAVASVIVAITETGHEVLWRGAPS